MDEPLQPLDDVERDVEYIGDEHNEKAIPETEEVVEAPKLLNKFGEEVLRKRKSEEAEAGVLRPLDPFEDDERSCSYQETPDISCNIPRFLSLRCAPQSSRLFHFPHDIL